MKLRWDDLRLFLAVAELGSLSAAARQLKLGQPTLSRRIGELEEVVGEALFIRHSVGIKLSQAGLKLLPAAQRMAEWANQAELSIAPELTKPHGKVRIAAPPGIAYELLAPMAARIRLDYPAMQIEALSGLSILNLGRGEADLSLRTSKPDDEDLVCIDEVFSPVRAYCSASYAVRLPAQPKLAELDWICWASSYDHLYVNQELARLIPDFTPAFTSDDFNVQVAACRAGVGVMVLAKALHRYSQLHELHELDMDLGTEVSGQLFLVCHKRHRNLPKVELVIRYLREEFDYLRQNHH
ncbi:LysR family transcriptional regulator [Undibacterium sp. JH2W]|uniref:LysR family transcriptional regulator n=1 Tax=Undibacterium sp. JH2W TaxID=3413037 RepID=UPI003BF0B096